MTKLAILFFVIVNTIGCTANQVKVDPEALNVRISTEPPPKNAIQIGPITARHGGGCGLYGARGNYEGAAKILRNKAAEVGANYAQVITQKGEHMKGLCLDRSYTIDAMAYRIKSDSSEPTKSVPSI